MSERNPTTISYHLAIFGADDRHIVDVPLTDDQAKAIRSTRVAPEGDPEFQYASYQIDNVFFEVHQDE